MRYVVVSTYPKEGSRNIGDKLIESSTVSAIRRNDPDASIEIFWRADRWENVRDACAAADHVVFACLAMYPGMEKVYPYLGKILETKVPVSAISSGTGLAPNASNLFSHGFSPEDLSLLRRFSGRATVFTTRGALTQAFCVSHGLMTAEFTGDVAFLDHRFDERKFRQLDSVRRIVISDPHAGEIFVGSFKRLVSVLAGIFPEARIDCAFHGENARIEKAARKLGLKVLPIFENPDHGLDIYDDYDLHAGFRVHGHVNALVRRIPSYLLEQDGRGCDYGLTLDRKISVPCYRSRRLWGTRTEQVLKLVRGRSIMRTVVSPAAADLLGALIAQDAARSFSNLVGLEETVKDFQGRTASAIRRICRGGA